MDWIIHNHLIKNALYRHDETLPGKANLKMENDGYLFCRCDMCPSLITFKVTMCMTMEAAPTCVLWVFSSTSRQITHAASASLGGSAFVGWTSLVPAVDSVQFLPGRLM